MKFLKLSLIALIVAIAVDFSLVYAYSSPSQSLISMELNNNDSKNTSFITKNVEKLQRYKSTSNITWLNNPCTDCKTATTLYGSNTLTMTMGNTKTFNDYSYFLGDYRLTIKRSDVTLLTTSHIGTWYVKS